MQKENLSGGQIQDILDHLILEAISAIIRASDIFDYQVSYLLVLCTKNKKRKISTIERTELISLLCEFLTSNDAERKIICIKNAKIERGFVYNFVVSFLKEVGDYTRLYELFYTNRSLDTFAKRHLQLKLAAIEKAVKSNRDRLFSAIKIAQDYIDLAYSFRNSVVKNYIKHARNQAEAYCRDKPTYNVDDLHQNFLAAITKAIDKYDSSKGALTSYINWWILYAQTNGNKSHGHEYGIAYNVPQLHKKSLATNCSTQQNFSISLDQNVSDDDSELHEFITGSVEPEEKLEKDELNNIIQYLAKCSDTRGIARLCLDIDEFFSKKELQKMKRHMLAEKVKLLT